MARILVIDDDPDTRALVEQVLKTAGHEVLLATDGKEAPDKYRTGHPDLVITDLYMREKGGLEAIVELRGISPDIPIIAMTGRVEAWGNVATAVRLGALEVLPKPFQISELLEVVTRTLQTAAKRGQKQ